jgi:hypothetical protein
VKWGVCHLADTMMAYWAVNFYAAFAFKGISIFENGLNIQKQSYRDL